MNQKLEAVMVVTLGDPPRRERDFLLSLALLFRTQRVRSGRAPRWERDFLRSLALPFLFHRETPRRHRGPRRRELAGSETGGMEVMRVELLKLLKC